VTETLIALTSALLGVLLSNGFAVWFEARRRAQRAIDMIVALHSEILAGVVANRRQLTPEEAHYALKQTSPFATPDETDFVFDSVKDDLSILPAEVIHPVVQYYRVAKQTNLITEDLRDPYFLAQSKSEKRKILRTLLELVEFQKTRRSGPGRIGRLCHEEGYRSCGQGKPRRFPHRTGAGRYYGGVQAIGIIGPVTQVSNCIRAPQASGQKLI
jgi:hypothetical protein